MECQCRQSDDPGWVVITNDFQGIHSHSKIRASVLGKEMTATPTGLSAYRLIVSQSDPRTCFEQDRLISTFIPQIPKEKLLTIPHVSAMMTDKDPWTTMLLGRDCRVVMGPCRQQSLLSIVALVPDSQSLQLAARLGPVH